VGEFASVLLTCSFVIRFSATSQRTVISNKIVGNRGIKILKWIFHTVRYCKQERSTVQYSRSKRQVVQDHDEAKTPTPVRIACEQQWYCSGRNGFPRGNNSRVVLPTVPSFTRRCCGVQCRNKPLWMNRMPSRMVTIMVTRQGRSLTEVAAPVTTNLPASIRQTPQPKIPPNSRQSSRPNSLPSNQ
jgi:hypothetical protein